MTERELKEIEARMANGSGRISGGPSIITADEIRGLIAEVRRLQGALHPFARLYRINAPLNLHPELPMRDFVPGAWPTLADCKAASECLPPTA